MPFIDFSKTPIEKLHDIIDIINKFIKHMESTTSHGVTILSTTKSAEERAAEFKEKTGTTMKDLAEQIDNCIEAYKSYGGSQAIEKAVKPLMIDYPMPNSSYKKMNGNEFLRLAIDVASRCEDCLCNMSNGETNTKEVKELIQEAENVVFTFTRYDDKLKNCIENSKKAEKNR